MPYIPSSLHGREFSHACATQNVDIKQQRMKTKLFKLSMATMLITGTMLTGCTSDQKMNAAEENVEEAKEEVTEAKEELREAKHEENMVVEQTEMQKEWKVFKTDMNVKITKNKETIDELKVKMKKPGKIMDAAYAKRIENLEAKNENLRTRLDEFENKQTDRDKFKREFDHDMGKLGNALKDLGPASQE